MSSSFFDAFSEKELALLRRRAEQAAQVDGDGLDGDMLIDVLRIEVGREAYALPLDTLTAAYQVDVNLASSIVPVPCTPSFLAGIANIRGHVVPVLDLGALLNLPLDSVRDAQSLVVVTNEQMTVALRVSAIGDPATLPLADFVPVPDSLALAKKHYIQGALPDGTGLLNIEAILSDPALIVNDPL